MTKAETNSEVKDRVFRLKLALTEIQDAAESIVGAIEHRGDLKSRLVTLEMIAFDLDSLEDLARLLEAREADAWGWE